MKKDWKEIFTDKVVAPLAIGHIVGGVGYIFEVDALLWIGVGLILYGFYVMLQGWYDKNWKIHKNLLWTK